MTRCWPSRGRPRATRALVLLTVLPLAALPLAVLAGCGSGGADRPAPGPTGTVTVLAAASLTEPLTRLTPLFQAAHPGVIVRASFGASSALAEQVRQGAPADLLAPADAPTMRRVADAGAIAGAPTPIARNALEIAVPPGNPGGVHGLADFSRSHLRLAVCAEQVPCGAAARTAFDRAAVTARPDTFEPDVKAVLTKVTLGEVDAGVVYRTDVRAAGRRVDGVAIPAADNVDTTCSAAVLRAASNPAAARAYLDFLVGAAGRAVLDDAGFTPP